MKYLLFKVKQFVLYKRGKSSYEYRAIKTLAAHVKAARRIALILSCHKIPYSMIHDGKFIITVDNTFCAGEMKARLKKLLPEIKDFQFKKWCPHDNKVILCWGTLNDQINIWVETTIEDDPTDKPDNKCKFVAIETKCYRLECKI